MVVTSAIGRGSHQARQNQGDARSANCPSKIKFHAAQNATVAGAESTRANAGAGTHFRFRGHIRTPTLSLIGAKLKRGFEQTGSFAGVVCALTVRACWRIPGAWTPSFWRSWRSRSWGTNAWRRWARFPSLPRRELDEAGWPSPAAFPFPLQNRSHGWNLRIPPTFPIPTIAAISASTSFSRN